MGRILFFVALAVAMWVAWTLSRRRNSLDKRSAVNSSACVPRSARLRESLASLQAR